jgi:DNA-binding NarL/FixJ family response regulator
MISPRVLIADDHLIYRQGLRSLLEDSFEIVGEAREGGEAVEKARSLRPDVVVMDIKMPGMDGVEASRQIKQHLPNTAVVIISASDEDEHIFAAIRAGATGYVVKFDEPDTMIAAVQNAAESKAYLSADVAKRVLLGVAGHMTNGSGLGDGTPLSSRETGVLRLIASGKRNRQIAEELCISERTVGNHVTSIYGKLHINDRAQAINYAIRKGLISI